MLALPRQETCTILKVFSLIFLVLIDILYIDFYEEIIQDVPITLTIIAQFSLGNQSCIYEYVSIDDYKKKLHRFTDS